MTSLSALVALVTALSAAGSAQEVRAQAGFAMAAPEGWHRINSEGLMENLEQVKMSPAELRKLLASSAASTFIVAYTKYQLTAHAGLIPKVPVTLQRNPAKTFERFFKMISRSAEEPKAYFRTWSSLTPLAKYR